MRLISRVQSACFLFLAGLVLCHVMPVPRAAAQDMAEAHGEALPSAAEFRDGLVSYATGLGWSLKIDGDVEAEQDDAGGVEYAIPPMRLGLENDMLLHFGPGTAYIEEGQQDGRFQVSLDLPEHVSAYEEADEPLFDLSIAQRGLTGTWSALYGGFDDFEMALEGLQLLRADGQGVMTADSLSAYMRSSLSGEGGHGHDSDSGFELVNLTLQNAGQHIERLEIGRMSSSGQLKDFDLLSYRQLTEDMNAIDPTESRQAFADYVDVFRRFLMLFHDADMTLSIEDFLYEMGNQSVLLEDGGIGLQILPGDDGWGDTVFTYSHSGLAVSPLPQAVDFMPISLDLTVALEHVQGEDFLVFLQGLFLAALEGGEAVPDIRNEIIGFLSDAESRFVLRNSVYSSESLTLGANGFLEFDLAAPQGVLGSVDLLLTGLDRLAQNLSRIPPSDQSEEQLNALLVIAIIQAIGQRETDQRGVSALRYQLALDAAGKTTLNGADITEILDGLNK